MKHEICIKGKKSGIVGSAISNFWSYVLFVFVVIVFFVFFSIQEREVRENFIGSLESEVNMDIVALNYMRTPITNNSNFADFIQELIAPMFLGTFDPELLDAINDKAREENLVGYRRLMIFLGDVTCLYDSRNQGCQSRQPSYFQIQEGAVFLPVPVKPNEIKTIEIVFQ